MDVRTIPLKAIDPNFKQPRVRFAAIEELAQSILEDGLLEPIMVRPLDGRFQIVHGERRYRAAKLAGLQDIPALVREADDEATFRYSLIENIQRSALTPMEEAASFARLQEEQGYTQAEIGRIIGKGQSYVAHKLRLLKIPGPLVYYLEVGALTENHLRQALRLKSVLGEEIHDDLKNYAATLEGYEKAFAGCSEPADRAATMILVRMRPYGRVDMMAPSEVLTGGVRRWVDYVLKHNDPCLLWERHAFWALSFMVYLEASVADASRLIDNLEALYLSAIANYNIDDMGADFVRDRSGRYYRAVYHDLKHAGLLDVVQTSPKDAGVGVRALQLRALNYAMNQGSLAHPSEAQGPGANEQLLEEIETRFDHIGVLREVGEE